MNPPDDKNVAEERIEAADVPESTSERRYDRRARAARSAQFVVHLRESAEDVAPLEDPVDHRAVAVDLGVFNALEERVRGLRELAAIRTRLPVTLARYRIARWAPVRKMLIKLINIASGPSRRQAELIADSVELLVREMRIARGIDRS